MKPYPEYKPSGVPWLGDIPAHWRVEKLKFLVRLRGDKTTGTHGLRYVGMEHVLPRVGKFATKILGAQEEAESTVNLFSRNDILFGKLRPYLAKCVVADSNGVCSSEFLVLVPNHGVLSPYLAATMLQPEFIQVVDGSTFGAKMPRADWGFIGQQRLPVPTEAEQQAMADYLDAETARIDTLIEAKEGLIELLQEAKSAAFASAIWALTNTDDGIKTSRFDWLRAIPYGWKTVKVKHITKSVDQGISPQCESHPPDDGQWGVLKVGCVNTGEFNPKEAKALPTDISPIEEITLKKGDVVISRANTKNLVGRASMADKDYPHLMLSDKHYRLRLDESECAPQFLVFVLTHAAVRIQIEERATGASPSMLNIERRTILDLSLPLPPLETQQLLIQTVNTERQNISKLISHTEDEVALLQQLRASTIAEVVLGRVDVRS